MGAFQSLQFSPDINLLLNDVHFAKPDFIYVGFSVAFMASIACLYINKVAKPVVMEMKKY